LAVIIDISGDPFSLRVVEKVVGLLWGSPLLIERVAWITWVVRVIVRFVKGIFRALRL
jgi:hypothetical protein